MCLHTVVVFGIFKRCRHRRRLSLVEVQIFVWWKVRRRLFALMDCSLNQSFRFVSDDPIVKCELQTTHLETNPGNAIQHSVRGNIVALHDLSLSTIFVNSFLSAGGSFQLAESNGIQMHSKTIKRWNWFLIEKKKFNCVYRNGTRGRWPSNNNTTSTSERSISVEGGRREEWQWLNGQNGKR